MIFLPRTFHALAAICLLTACLLTAIGHASASASIPFSNTDRFAIAPPPPDTVFYLRDTFCASQTVLIGNQFFDPSNPSGKVTLPGAAVGGKDSIIFVELKFSQPVTNNLTATFCEGDTIRVNGTAYHAGFFLGQEVIARGAKNGCDSIININLTFTKRGVFDYQATTCEGDTILVGGQIFDMFNPTGEQLLPGAGANGCDSLVRINLTFVTPPFSNVRDTLCPEDFRIINGRRYDKDNRAGLEILQGASVNGCDSLVNIDYKFQQLYVYLGEDMSIVQGDVVCLEPLFGLVPEKIEWTPALPLSDTCVFPLTSVTYKIIVTDTGGCVLSDEIRIAVRKKNRVYAPNVFNPDADYPNNRFFLSADRQVTLIRRLSIADRWGELVYDIENILPDDASVGWDGYVKGHIGHVDTYIFWATLEKADGTIFEESGGFTLIR